jgi:hypothetical protein
MPLVEGLLFAGAVSLAVLAVARGVEWGVGSAVLTALGSGVELLRRRIEPVDRTIRDPAVVARLVDEAALAMAARSWPGDVDNAEWVMRQMEPFVEKPALTKRRRNVRDVVQDANRRLEATSGAERRNRVGQYWSSYLAAIKPRQSLADALRDAERRLDETSHWSRAEGYSRVRAVLEPVLAALPTERDYLNELKHVDTAQRPSVIKSRYYERSPPRNDFWAWNYLLLLAHLGERDVLLPILRDRIKAAITEAGEKVYCASACLPKQVLLDEYRTWSEEEVGALHEAVANPCREEMPHVSVPSR